MEIGGEFKQETCCGQAAEIQVVRLSKIIFCCYPNYGGEKWKIIFKPGPFKRVLAWLEKGDADIGLGFKIKDRDVFATYLGDHPIHWSSYKIFVKKGHSFPFNRIEDLYGKRIGKNRGFSAKRDFDKAVSEKKIIIHEVNSYSSLIGILMAERVEGILGNSQTIMFHYNKNEFSESILPLEKSVIPPTGAYLMMSKAADIKNREALVKKINQSISDIVKDGTLTQIESQYPGYSYAP